MALDLGGAFGYSAAGDGSFGVKIDPDTQQAIPQTEPDPNAQTPDYSHTFAIDSCVEAFELDGVEFPETAFAYAYRIEFDSYKDLQAFTSHPQREMIGNTIIKSVEAAVSTNIDNPGVVSDLELEVSRDFDEGGDPTNFTDETLGDMDVSTEDIVPMINQSYGLNITLGEVQEGSSAITGGCLAPYIGPNDFAEKLPAVSRTADALKM